MPALPILVRAALAHHKAGRLDQAEDGYLKVLKVHRDDATALLFLGVLRYDRRDFDEAIRLISRAIELNPAEPLAHNHMGLALLARNELEGAVQAFQSALRLKPANLDALNNLANALKKLKRPDEAERTFLEILQIEPRHVFATYNLGLLLFEQRRFAEAEARFTSALQLAPAFHKAHYQLGRTAENMGRFADAAVRYERALQTEPDHVPALTAILGLRDYQPDDALIAKAQRMAAREDVPAPECYTLCYAIAKRFETHREYDRAFDYLRLANQRRGRSRKYEPAKVSAIFSRYEQAFTRELMSRHAGGGSDSERPVFVVGMPRTGTTLTEQILAAHPNIFGAGELEDLPRVANRLPTVMSHALGRAVLPYPQCLENLDGELKRAMCSYYMNALSTHDAMAPRVVDKNPFNFLNVGLIALLFPKARILHCHRNPLDVGLSCYTELFELKQDFTTDFGHFAHYYAHYQRLMRHWTRALQIQVLDVPYERLVSEPERMSREMIAFCGMPWSDECLTFQQTGRAVLTPSKWQVRQPIYRSSVERWRHYAKHIEPLRVALLAEGVPALER